MKRPIQFFSKSRWINLVAALLLTTAIFSCEDDPEPAVPPVVSASTNALSGIPGSEVTATINAEAKGGLSAIKIRRNGIPDAAFPDATFNGIVTTGSYEFKFRIPTTFNEGDQVVFLFNSVDKAGLTSTDAVITVTANAIPNKPIVEVTGTITANTTWTRGNIYRLNGFVRVGNDPAIGTIPAKDSGPTLTIEPGTVIYGDRETKGTLIVQRGAKIIANGTAALPIVFTSEAPVGSKEPGDWGGLVICGRASNNQANGYFELEGGYAAWSGGGSAPDDDDNSGSLKYVRLEYAGVPINPNQEVNSLTMGAVGRGTTIEYVQATYGLDDAFEWFGGTVNAKYLVAFKGLDDDFDVDFGFSGFVQYGLGVRGATLADQSGSNGFEVDNDGQGSLTAPFTSGTFSNITIIGPKATRETPVSLQFQSAAHLRRSNRLKIHNSFFTGYPNGIFIDGTNTVNHAASGELVLKNNVLAGVDNWGGNGFGSAGTIFTTAPANGANHPNAPRGFRVGAGTASFSNGVFTLTQLPIADKTAEAWFLENNQILNKWQDAGIDPTLFATNSPKVTPNAGSVLLTGASFTGLPSFFTPVTFRGAFGTTDWTAGWVEWVPELKDYSKGL
ncbi:Ig-like domain repeat protein [Algoriphagus sp.]|uniref:Ig-like domain repeat protein n=1 Tax=Algoriphagus sp. TaxID=1872435 RepID=UPI00271F49ED|nr:Ig-like domain repeat protein [Algoriphagus sp.]MDO8968024.1 Ig-like domain repeat protein [Algoriphagus sp.]MDP3199096.1 Ig-like domain repeat protein [Algoriphagus sp.]